MKRSICSKPNNSKNQASSNNELELINCTINSCSKHVRGSECTLSTKIAINS